MGTLSEDIDVLRSWRENNDRKSSEVVEKWNNRLNNNVDKLGKERQIILEQVCLASLDCHDLNIAKKCVNHLYKEFPNSLRVKKLEAMCYEAGEKYEDALTILDDIIKVDETNSSARKRKIAILKAQNKNIDAIKELVEYLKTYMADPEAWQELSELYLNEQDFNKAIFCMEELVLHNPHNHLLYQRLADIRYTQGGFDNLEQAKMYYSQAIKLNPRNIRALYGLYLVCSSLVNSSRSTPQKKKECSKLASFALSEIKKLYEDAKIDQVEERLAAIQL